MNHKGILISIVAVVLIALLASYIYFKNQQNDAAAAIDAVPVNAAAIIEIKDLQSTIAKAEASTVFTDLKSIAGADAFCENLLKLDSTIATNIDLCQMLKGKSAVISFHNTMRFRYDKLAVMVFTSNSQGKRVQELLEHYLEPSFNIKTEKYDRAKIAHCISRKGEKSTLYLTFYQGYLMISTNEMLLQDAIRQTENNFGIGANPSFVKVKQWSGKNVEANIYVQFKFLNPFIERQFTDNLFSNMGIQNFSDWGGFDLSIKTENWLLNGFTLQNAVKNQWSQLFEGQEPVSTGLVCRVPLGVNGFTWFGISNFAKYQRTLESYMESIGQQSRHQTNQAAVKKVLGGAANNMLADNLGRGTMIVSMPDGSTISVVEAKGNYEAKKLMEAITAGATSREFRIDSDTRYDVYEMAVQQLPARIFGPWFGQCMAQFACRLDNCIVFGDSYAVVTRFVYDNVLHKNLHYEPDYDRFSNYITNKANFYSFTSLTGSDALLSRILSGSNSINYHTNQAALFNFYGIAWQFSAEDGLLYHNALLRHQPSRTITASTLWETHLDTLAAFKPVLVENHNTGEKEIFIQDLHNNLYLINAAGRIMWKKQIDEPIIGTVQQIDYYRNGKLQIFFNTATKMYLLYRNGNNVDRYPIVLPSPTNLPVAVFDYEHNRNYRMFVLCSNAEVHIYSANGKTLPDFVLHEANQPPIARAQHFNNSGKDYIAITDTSRVYLIDRRGNMRVDFNERIHPSVNNELKLINTISDSTAMLVRTSADGTICFLHFDGKIGKRKVADFSPRHFFDIEDICGDSQPELIYADSNKLTVYTFGGKKIFDYKFAETIKQRPAYYKLSATQTAIGVTESDAANIYLIDTKGHSLPGFPLRGKTRFSIGVMQAGQTYYNLIVGGNDQYLFNYKINKP